MVALARFRKALQMLMEAWVLDGIAVTKAATNVLDLQIMVDGAHEFLGQLFFVLGSAVACGGFITGSALPLLPSVIQESGWRSRSTLAGLGAD